MATATSQVASQLQMLTTLLRRMFPHAQFPDGPYERAAAAIQQAGEEDPRRPRSSPRARASSRRAGFADLDADAALALPAGDQRHRVLPDGALQVHHHALRRPRGLGACSATRVRSFDQGGYLGPRLRRPRLAARPARSRRRLDMQRHERQDPRAARSSATDARARPSAIEHDDDDVVVIVGSGAGGGTLANELTPAGRQRAWCWRPAPHLTPDDYVQRRVGRRSTRWPGWTRGPRRARWRVAQDFPNLPAWIVKAVGGTTTHWAGATPRFKDARVQGPDRTYGGIDGANLLDWPITLDDLAPYYDKAETSIGVDPPPRPPAAAGEQQLQGVRQRRRAGRLQRLRHRALRRPTPSPTTAARRSIQDGFNFQGDKHGSKWSTLVARDPAGAWPPATSTCGRTAHAVQITHDAQGRVDAVLYLDADGPAPAGGPGGLRRRQRDRDAAAAAADRAVALHPDGLANSSGQVGPQLHAAH